MATLRSGKKLDANANSEEVSEKSKEEVPKKDRTTLVVFFGLLIDLLGKIDEIKESYLLVNCSAFTLILPLFPSLISHYREHDSSGLFRLLEEKVDFFRVLAGVPVQFNTVLFGGLLGSVFSFLQFLASPVIGGLSDRFGRKPLMIATCTGNVSALLSAQQSKVMLRYLAVLPPLGPFQ